MQNSVFHIGSLEIGQDRGRNVETLNTVLEKAAEMGVSSIIHTGTFVSSDYLDNDDVAEALSRAEPIEGDLSIYTVSALRSQTIEEFKSAFNISISSLGTSPTCIADNVALYGVGSSGNRDAFDEIRDLEPSSEGYDNVLCVDASLSPVADDPDINGSRIVLDSGISLNSLDAILGGDFPVSTSGEVSGVEVYHAGNLASEHLVNAYTFEDSQVEAASIELNASPSATGQSSGFVERFRKSPEDVREEVDDNPSEYVDEFDSILECVESEKGKVSRMASEAAASIAKDHAWDVQRHTGSVVSLIRENSVKENQNLSNIVRTLGHLSKSSHGTVSEVSDELTSLLYTEDHSLAAWSAWTLSKLADNSKDPTNSFSDEHRGRLRELLHSEKPIAVRYSALALGSVSVSQQDLESLEEAVERHSDEDYITQTANKAIDRIRRRVDGEDEGTDVDQLLQRLRDSRRYKGQIVEERLEEGGGGEFEDIEMHEEVEEVLRSRGIGRLYTHQAEAIQSLRDGDNVVISTETASGKSMVYTIPALERAIKNDLRTLYIGPQNALVNDQRDTLSEIFDDVSSANEGVFGSGLEVEKYTGQLDKASRRTVRRKRPSMLLTNPDMIHYSLLPYSDNLWSWLFASLDLVVVDEVHEYRGVFGSHVGMVLRRLRRIAERNGSSPQFVCCSATIRNPVEHAANVTGEDEETFSLHDTDYSESGDKKWVLWNPPRTGGEDNKRRSNHTESVRLFSDLVSSGYQTITFTRTRQGAEEYAMRSENELRGRNEHEKATSVQAYEGALTQTRRGEIEEGLKTGEIEGVWSTSALELGVDIGGLDSVILDGYPGTLMEAYQRAGRAGRGEDESLVALVASDNPLDQYMVSNPEEFFSKAPERAVVNPENESIMQDHLRAAADEEPLMSMDERFFGEKLSEMSSETEGIAIRDGRWTYRNGSPHYGMNIRSINDVTVEVKTTSGRELANLDFESALRDVHPGAYYFHQGEKYKVKHLDLDDYVATVTPTSDRHITRVVRRKEIYVNEDLRERSLSSDLTVKFADLGVSTRFPEYAIVDRKSDTVVEKVDLDLPSSQIQTKGLYFSVPPKFLNEVEDAGEEDEVLSGLHAAEHALISMFPLEVLCDRRDIGGLSIDLHPHTGKPTIFIHGAHEGGVGICSSAYDSFETIVSRAQSVVESCSCSGGCPSCVYSPHCGNLNEDLSKPKAERLLTVMSQRMN